jgi:hypothetical protein
MVSARSAWRWAFRLGAASVAARADGIPHGRVPRVRYDPLRVATGTLLAGQEAACAMTSDCCTGLTCAAPNQGGSICCASGKSCFDPTDSSVDYCVNAGAVCWATGGACCESGLVCGLGSLEVCGQPGESCCFNPNTEEGRCCAAGTSCLDPNTGTCG